MRGRVGHRETGKAARANTEPVSDVAFGDLSDVACDSTNVQLSRDYPPEDVSPELGALVAIALVLLLGGGARVGYVAARIVRWLV